ncbi:RNA polymerase factor sigma-54 [Chlamydia sp. 17-3921]|uniref:RNA polymerase factor sigma-54 n=1 Tax=Chlamydia sp. 17-3921 TaxID=2675798 RepID=UPI0019188278|nr:RNA polymerase factor sigma-54 [Chlamydia sp. 17-3921]
MFQQKQQLSLKYLPSLRMQQGLQMLQTPIAELSSYVIQELINNPFFDLSSLEEEEWHQKSSSANFEATFAQPASLSSVLLSQIHHTFHTTEDLLVAYHITGNLSKEGFFVESPEFIAEQLNISLEKVHTVWRIIQTFHPIGISSPSLQSYWLMRLDNTVHQLAYQIILQCYPALTNCNFNLIAKRFHLSLKDLRKLLRKALGSIPWCPAAEYQAGTTSLAPPCPDIYIDYNEGWEIRINSKNLPPIKLNHQAFQLYEHLPKEEKKTLTQQILAAKWLIKNLKKREQTLFAIVEKLLPYQENFLLGRTFSPRPLTIKSIAENLRCHESTVFRAVNNKSIASPIGILPLKQLFPRTISTEETSLSKETILKWIRQWTTTEQSPLSDQDISEKISAKGISCARRTVTKYRSQLKILPAHKRKARFHM